SQINEAVRAGLRHPFTGIPGGRSKVVTEAEVIAPQQRAMAEAAAAAEAAMAAAVRRRPPDAKPASTRRIPPQREPATAAAPPTTRLTLRRRRGPHAARALLRRVGCRRKTGPSSIMVTRTPPRPSQAPPTVEVPVYDGRTSLGSLRRCGEAHEARDASGRVLG